ncbi:hypothetical protein ACLB2K_004797 [Fragaria x ananassa]
MSTMRMKHLSSVANDVVQACAVRLNTSVDKLVEEFEATSSWNNETAPSHGAGAGGCTYGRKLIEFCSAKGVSELCQNNIEEKIADGIFSRFTFDMMLSWEIPDSSQEDSFTGAVPKRTSAQSLKCGCPSFSTGRLQQRRVSTLADSSSVPDHFLSPASLPNSSFPARSILFEVLGDLDEKMEFGGLTGEGK